MFPNYDGISLCQLIVSIECRNSVRRFFFFFLSFSPSLCVYVKIWGVGESKTKRVKHFRSNITIEDCLSRHAHSMFSFWYLLLWLTITKTFIYTKKSHTVQLSRMYNYIVSMPQQIQTHIPHSLSEFRRVFRCWSPELIQRQTVSIQFDLFFKNANKIKRIVC